MAKSVLAGDRLALSRLLTQIENNTTLGHNVMDELFAHTGRAHLVGVTGAPGTGKSSLVNRLALHYRSPPDGGSPMRVAIVAVDPTSPFTGGAVLGDRIRMRDLAGDDGVFIRSMATRGALGGLARTTSRMVEVFDAAGYNLIFIETVGAGQVEVDIARLAHTTVVIDAPGLGDDVQAIKAGILEIADILVVNKADRPGAEQTLRALKQMMNLAHPTRKEFQHHGLAPVNSTAPADDKNDRGGGDDKNELFWFPPIVSTVATEGEGVAELAGLIEKHRRFLDQTGEGRRRDRARLESGLEEAIRNRLMGEWRAKADPLQVERIIQDLSKRSITPAEALTGLLGDAEEQT
ncbi:MAG: methylmalonyl Co-A mutase-associated GTPase MeaB [Anaerolineales bacterium]|nr:methylmalonyl Co-A mutase-associated GTPase MeaB [Anaerolineales bacterium]